MSKLYWKEVEIGDPIPPLAKAALSRASIVVFSVRAGETGPLHIDEEFARQAGFGSISAPGLLGMAVATEMLEGWLDNGQILSVATRFQKLIWPGDTLTAKGVVVRKYEQDRQHRMDCDVWVQNQANDIVVKGTAVCALFLDVAEERKNKGRHEESTTHLGPVPKPVQIATEAMRAAHAASEARARRPIPASAPAQAARPAAARIVAAPVAQASRKPLPPAKAAPSAKQPAPTKKPAPAKQSAPAKKAAPAKQPAPAKKAAPAKQPAPATKAAPAKQPAPAKKPAPAKQSAPTKKPAPAKQSAPTKKAAPAKQPAPAKKPAPAKQPAPAKKPAPAKQPAPASKAAPVKKPAPAKKR